MSSMTTHPCLKRKGRHIFPLGACPHCELKSAKAEIERLEASRKKIFESADGEIERLRAELAASREREARMRAMIADDGHAMTFQSFGQYRTALLRALAEGAQG